MNKSLYFISLIMIWLFLTTTAFSKPYIVSAQNLGIAADWAQFSVKITTDKKIYKAGDCLVATVHPERDCYILVYYTNENGYCLIVYPNSFESENFIRGRENFVIGNNPSIFSLQVDTHKVRDYLQVIATDEPIDVTSLAGIRNPEEFITRIRLILKERVEQRARELKDTSNVPLHKRVFGIGTTDYQCNMSSYSEPSIPTEQMSALAPVPMTPSGPSPQINIRTVIPPEVGKERIWGPSAPIDRTSVSGDTYEIESPSAIVMGTVSYIKGVKSVLVNGVKPTIKRIGSAKAIIIEAGTEETYKELDFQYQIDDLSTAPRDVVIITEGMDGTTSRKVIRVKSK